MVLSNHLPLLLRELPLPGPDPVLLPEFQTAVLFWSRRLRCTHLFLWMQSMHSYLLLHLLLFPDTGNCNLLRLR